MVRTPEHWSAVMASPLMTKEIYEVYSALWGAQDGLTRGEIERQCLSWGWQKNPEKPWDKTVALMSQMGIAKRGSKRHCSVKNKPDVVWVLTEATVLRKPKVPKPSAKKYAAAVRELQQMLDYHRQGGPVSAELEKLVSWVVDKAPEVK